MYEEDLHKHVYTETVLMYHTEILWRMDKNSAQNKTIPYPFIYTCH